MITNIDIFRKELRLYSIVHETKHNYDNKEVWPLHELYTIYYWP